MADWVPFQLGALGLYDATSLHPSTAALHSGGEARGRDPCISPGGAWGWGRGRWELPLFTFYSAAPGGVGFGNRGLHSLGVGFLRGAPNHQRVTWGWGRQVTHGRFTVWLGAVDDRWFIR